MAFGESWMISIMMRFASNGSQVMNEIANVTGSANARIDEHTRKVNEATAAWNRFNVATVKAGTMFAGGGALVGLAAIAYGINQAAKLQLAMTGLYASTGTLHDAAMQKRLFDMVVGTSGITAQSATTIATEASMLGSGGLNDPKLLLNAFPQIAKAADVLMLSTMGTPRAVNPVDAASQMLAVAHLFGDYQGKPLHDAIDAMVRLQMVQPAALSKVLTQAKYFVPTAIAAGVNLQNLPQSDLLALMASGGQLGLMSGRMGTGLARYIQYMEKAPTLTSHLSKIQRSSMIDLGIFDASGRNKFLDSSGNFELGASMHYLGEKYDDMIKSGHRAQFLADLYGAFLQQGGQFTSAMLLPQVRAQRQRNIAGMAGVAPPGSAVEALWDAYMHTTVGAWKYFTTNFQNIWIYTFTPMLPDITNDLLTVGHAFGQFGNTLKDHPEMAAMFAKTIEGLTALAGTRYLLGGAGWLFSTAAGLKGLAAAGSLAEGTKLTALAVGVRGLDNVLTGGMITNLAKLTGGIGALGLTIAAVANMQLFKWGQDFLKTHPLSPAEVREVGLSAEVMHALGLDKYLPNSSFIGPPDPPKKLAWNRASPFAPWLQNIQSNLDPFQNAIRNALLGDPYGAAVGGNRGARTPQGALPTTLDSRSIHELKPLSKEQTTAAVSAAMRANPSQIQVTISDRTQAGIRSIVSSRGNIQTSRYAPPVLNMDTVGADNGH
jgi:hypothetical protein